MEQTYPGQHQGAELCTEAPQDQRQIIILVVGPTGSGKSTFINEYLGRDMMLVNHGLGSCTQEIACATTTLPKDHPKWPSHRISLADTPGFNDTKRGDLEVLGNIAAWLASSYTNGQGITGMIYLHNIANTRMGGTALNSYDLFRQMCGKDALNRVVLATTHWEGIDPEIGKEREEDLVNEFWAEALANGATYRRLQIPECDAGDIIEHILMNQFEPIAIQIQKGMVDQRKRVEQTRAGKMLKDTLQKRSFGERGTVAHVPRERWSFALLIRKVLAFVLDFVLHSSLY